MFIDPNQSVLCPCGLLLVEMPPAAAAMLAVLPVAVLALAVVAVAVLPLHVAVAVVLTCTHPHIRKLINIYKLSNKLTYPMMVGRGPVLHTVDEPVITPGHREMSMCRYCRYY